VKLGNELQWMRVLLGLVDEPGIADSIASPLARINISIYYISTFDTDHLLVKYKDSDKAIDELLQNSFLISQNNFN